MSLMSKSTPASFAIASMCKTVLELPPIAISTANAFLMAFSLRIFRNLKRSSSAISHMRRAAFRTSSSLSGVRAKIVPFPGRAIPMASISVFIEFAVNIPEHEPPLGQALHSIS